MASDFVELQLAVVVVYEEVFHYFDLAYSREAIRDFRTLGRVFGTIDGRATTIIERYAGIWCL